MHNTLRGIRKREQQESKDQGTWNMSGWKRETETFDPRESSFSHSDAEATKHHVVYPKGMMMQDKKLFVRNCKQIAKKGEWRWCSISWRRNISLIRLPWEGESLRQNEAVNQTLREEEQEEEGKQMSLFKCLMTSPQSEELLTKSVDGEEIEINTTERQELKQTWWINKTLLDHVLLVL